MITFSDFKINLKKRWKSVVFLANLSLFLGLGLSLIQPFLYKTNFSVLLVQDTKESTNIYSSIESSDKLARLLQKMIKTSDFQNSILSSDFNINKDDFSAEEAKKRKQWNKMIDISVVPGTGILNFDIYYKNRSGAEEYAKAIVSSIVNDGAQIYGGSSSIKFKVINSPLTSDRPVTPNIIVNAVLSILIGLFASLFYLYFTTTEVVKKDVFFDEELEKDNNNDVDKKYKDVIKKDISFLPNSNINKIDEEIEQIIQPEVENIEHIVEEKVIQTIQNNNDVKVIQEEDVVHNVGFLKNVNDRVKSVINKE